MFINHWLGRFCTDGILPLTDPAHCNLPKVHAHNEYMLGYVKQLQSLGAKITMNALDIETELLNPLSMVDFNGVIEDNIKPFRLSWFTNKYSEVIGVFDKWMRKH
jgi:hypothetical protein